LLLFLRGHPEVVRLVVRSKEGRPLIATGRRGGVPVLWVSSSPTGLEGAAVAPDRPRLTTLVAFGAPADPAAPVPTPDGVTLEAEIAPAALLTQGEPESDPALVSSGSTAPTEASHACQLRDADGHVLARPGTRASAAAGAEVARSPQLEAEAPLRAEGWSAAG